jgi:hypothetical protein
MGIELTKEEMELVRKGELDPNKILEHRQINPPKEEPLEEIEQVKEDIRQANIGYKAAIQKNKDLYKELEDNRKVKEEFRLKIAELRIKKKKLLGIVD